MNHAKRPGSGAIRAAVAVLVCALCFRLGVWWEGRRASVPAPGPSAAGRAPDAAPAAPRQPPAAASDAGASATPTSIRAEYNPQSALLIGANEMVAVHQRAFKELVAAVWDRIPVIGLVNNDDEIDLAHDLLAEAGLPMDAVHLVKHPLDSMWVRDYGPLFARLSDGTVRIVDAEYRGTGERGDRVVDDEFPAFVGRTLGIPVLPLPLSLEGGNVLHNGDGLLVTSTRVIDQNRARSFTLEEMGELLHSRFGSRSWVYVRPLEGEPTGHADYFMCFVRRNHVVIGSYDPAYDAANAEILDEAARVMAGQPTLMGPMMVERIPMPPRSASGAWRSFCNVLFVNGVLLMPSFSDVDPALERKAKETFERLLPSWKVVPIHADTIAEKRGVLHCVGVCIPAYVDVSSLLARAAPSGR